MLSGVIADAPIDSMNSEDDVPPDDSGSLVVHQTRTQPKQAEVQQPTPIPKAEPKASNPMTLEDYLNSMTLEEAKNVKVDCGYNTGKTLGEVAMRKPSDLDWYVQKYNGRNLGSEGGCDPAGQRRFREGRIMPDTYGMEVMSSGLHG